MNRPDPLRYFIYSIGGVGVFIPRDKFIRISLFRNINRPFVASESRATPVTFLWLPLKVTKHPMLNVF